MKTTATPTNALFRLLFGNPGHWPLSRRPRADGRLVLPCRGRFERLEDRRMLSAGTPQCEFPGLLFPAAEEYLGSSAEASSMHERLGETEVAPPLSKPSGAWIPYTPTPGNTRIDLSNDGNSQQASVDLEFSDAGFRVRKWGAVERHGATFAVNATIERSTGPSLQVITSAEHAYSLGTLNAGEYVFEFWANGTLVLSKGFACSANDLAPTHDAANANHDLADKALTDLYAGLMLGDGFLIDYNTARTGRLVDSATLDVPDVQVVETPGEPMANRGIEPARRIDLPAVAMRESGHLVGVERAAVGGVGEVAVGVGVEQASDGRVDSREDPYVVGRTGGGLDRGPRSEQLPRLLMEIP